MSTRPTWSAWFESNTNTVQSNQQAPPLPASSPYLTSQQQHQFQSPNAYERGSYYQASEYGDRPQSFFPTHDQYSKDDIPLRPQRQDSYYGPRVDEEQNAYESGRPFITPDASLQEDYYIRGPGANKTLSPPRGSSTIPDRNSSASGGGALPPPVQAQPTPLTPADKAMLDPEVQRQMAARRTWRPWFSWITAIIMTGVLAYEFYRNRELTGNLIETGKGGQAFNIMIGPAASILINVGARFVPCMHDTKYTTANFICLNATDSVSSSGTTTDINQICSLESWCGFNGFPNGVPNQWFRFITPVFIHGGIIHLVMNMLLQLRVGAQLERDLGFLRFGIIYMTSGIMGFIFGGNFAPIKQTSMGASGALFGLIGCLLVDLILNWRLIVKPAWELTKLLILVIVSFAIGLLQWFDNFSHIGGFFTGILTGIIFMPAIRFSRKYMIGIWIARAIALPLLIVLLVLGILNFEGSSDPGANCSWCRYFSCLPINGWCDAFNNQ